MTPRPAPHIIRWFLRTFGYGGITLPPLGIFILAERLHQDWLVRHEQAHWAQRKGRLAYSDNQYHKQGALIEARHKV
jgi:hypothetical protein